MTAADAATTLFQRHHSILITGGTGTFGRAFAHYALDHGAQRVCIYSRGEHAQAGMREQLAAEADRMRYFIGDIRDPARLEMAMHGCTLVIHAAALKRVEVGEQNPLEMVSTNVDGARNVIQAAWACSKRYGNHRPVHTVFLSSDKACAPLNTYGATKLVAEKMFQGAANMYGAAGPIFTITRYGNVAGSQGSVIPIWRKALREGTLPRITHPQATRFWMTLQQAVDLVVRAGLTVPSGYTLVPKLPSYDLISLAGAMGLDMGKMERIGMQPGEKPHESMVSWDEMGEFFDSLDDSLYVRPPAVDRFHWAESSSKLERPQTSDQAKRLSEKELYDLLKEIPHG